MTNRFLHITNGSCLTNYLKDLNIRGEFFTWHEMLSEGPTCEIVDSQQFLNIRKAFLSDFYQIEIDEYAFQEDLKIFNNLDDYSDIILWFEYDLFCHVNLIAIISLLQQKNVSLPLSLVCSGRIKGDSELKSLSELNESQLIEHFDNRIVLSENDIDTASILWKIYCGDNHNLIKPYILKSTSFKYLNSCLKAHLKRFPDSQNGLSRLEKHILEIVHEQDIKSKHHLLGYVLNYQGYYGYGDLQIERIIDYLEFFFNINKNEVVLNRFGHEALNNKQNFFNHIDNNISFGGAKRSDYYFHQKQNKLINTTYNAH